MRKQQKIISMKCNCAENQKKKKRNKYGLMKCSMSSYVAQRLELRMGTLGNILTFMSCSSMLSKLSLLLSKFEFAGHELKVKFLLSPPPRSFFSFACLTLPGLACIADTLNLLYLYDNGLGDAWAGCNAGYTGIYSWKKGSSRKCWEW